MKRTLACASALATLAVSATGAAAPAGASWRAGEAVLSVAAGRAEPAPAAVMTKAAVPAEPPRAAEIRASLLFPAVMRPADIDGIPIWADASGASFNHAEVAWFRTAFEVAVGETGQARIAVFADTRFELLVDGKFVGRGPARFDTRVHEMDVFGLPLGAGRHHLAVVAQWAPNLRRSVSTAPVLLAEVRTAAGRIAARSSPDWEARVATEWLPSVPVHADGLVGPTEILDLSAIPSDWAIGAGAQAPWPLAAVVAAPPGRLAIRTAPAPITTTLVPAVLETGRLSPGQTMFSGEIAQPLQAVEDGTLALEALAPADGILLDGTPLVWSPVADRLDVTRSSRPVSAGAHRLDLGGAPAVAVSGVSGLGPPGWRGRDPGARLLLADLVPGSGVTVVNDTEAGLRLTFAEPGYAILDLGRTVHGRVRGLAVASSAAGAAIDIGWSERLLDGRRPLPYPGSLQPGWSQADAWILDTVPLPVSTLDARAGRYLLVAAWAPAELSAFTVEEEAYRTDPVGAFVSDDPSLDRIWRIGADTLRANMTDAYADPWRERGQWWGDAYVAIHTNRVAYGDAFLWRRGLKLMAAAHRDGRPPAMAPNHEPDTVLLDYGLLWIISLSEYVSLTGDMEATAMTAPVVEAALEYYAGWGDPAGLISLPPGPWQVKALIDWAGQFDREGEIAALNALYAGALDAAATLSHMLEDARREADRRAAAASVRRALNAAMFDINAGRYATAVVNGQLLPPWPHAQAWPLVYEVPVAAETQRVADALVELTSDDPRHANVEIYGMFWVLEALGLTGNTADGAELIRELYGSLATAGFTTWPEVFDPGPRWSWSHSHAWGTAPTWFLTTYVLGVRQVGPDSWRLTPAFGGVGRASGTLPLLQAPAAQNRGLASIPPVHPAPRLLSAEWSGGRCGSRSVAYDAPADSSGHVVLLEATDASIIADGRLVWSNGRATLPGVTRDGDSVIVPGAAGAHTLVVNAPPCR